MRTIRFDEILFLNLSNKIHNRIRSPTGNGDLNWFQRKRPT
ncbi:hypothetical protein LEP1GSC036_3776 [Leptospira weilii str. 2006001853]|uniref:Uncharacterized protein n=1 Tax=Leptospira weilii str. 2006001853 TaxID=1001589 RepID=A0A828Z1E2_9LEPT|nr:hypothetical protein LEP1GSC036_3776 [Leptospira weilii str. 2006001853]